MAYGHNAHSCEPLKKNWQCRMKQMLKKQQQQQQQQQQQNQHTNEYFNCNDNNDIHHQLL